MRLCAVVLSFLCPVSLAVPLWASSDCADTITADDGYKIRKTVIGARYLHLPPGVVPAKGSAYSPVVVTDIVNAVNEAVKTNSLDTQVQLTGKIPVVNLQPVLSCVHIVNPSACTSDVGQELCVDINIRSLGLGLDPGNLAKNLLAVARSPNNTFFRGVPATLKLLNPGFGLASDRTLGVTPFLHTTTNLLDSGKTIRNETLAISPNHLDINTTAQGSFNNPYYDVGAELAYLHDAGGLNREYGISAEFVAGHQPLGQGNNVWNGLNVTSSLRWKPRNPFISNVLLDLRYGWTDNRVSGTAQNHRSSTENSGAARVLLDFRWLQSFTRVSLWFDGAVPAKPLSSYRRLASIIGWQKDFGKGNQTLGIEAMVGGGYSWGTVPDYSRFFGGNAGANFIYAGPRSAELSAFPSGPVLRSYGRNQVTLSNGLGGTSYWHFNVNLAVPIPFLSRPLIPRETICFDTVDDSEKCLTLSEIIKGQVSKSGKSFLTMSYKSKGMTKDEAERRATADLKGVTSLVEYIVDRANLYALKPLVMTDGGNVYGPGAAASSTRFSVGGGVQFVLVTAKFEAGYLRSVPTFSGQSSGNFVMRLVFQNLF